jgi:hypothetical protein
MIYRFSARQTGSQETFEAQLQSPPDQSIEAIIPVLRETFSRNGIELDSIEYVGSIDTDFEGIVVPANEIDAPSTLSAKGCTAAIHGWYTPGGKVAANNECEFPGCFRKSSFHLCDQHAIPGIVVEVNGDSFVIGHWLVERAGSTLLISLNDYTLGGLGGQQQFEDRLTGQGYKVHGLISSAEELKARRRSGLSSRLWSPNLPDGEDSQ